MKFHLNTESTISRDDLLVIAKMLPEKARVLDLGCGSGRLLKSLTILKKETTVMGVEFSQDKVIECIGRGVPVIHANLDDGLREFADGSYDFVILSHTLQALRKPDLLLDEMLRVGRTGIVSFLNIGFWRARLQLFFGNMPVTKTLPLQWYDTPNIHLGTISDFRNLCRSRGIRIVKEMPLPQEGDSFGFLKDVWPNLFASTCVFIIER